MRDIHREHVRQGAGKRLNLNRVGKLQQHTVAKLHSRCLAFETHGYACANRLVHFDMHEVDMHDVAGARVMLDVPHQRGVGHAVAQREPDQRRRRVPPQKTAELQFVDLNRQRHSMAPENVGRDQPLLAQTLDLLAHHRAPFCGERYLLRHLFSLPSTHRHGMRTRARQTRARPAVIVPV